MTNTKRSLSFLFLFAAIGCMPSCKTTGTPDGGSTIGAVATNIKDVTVDCAASITGPIAGAEIPKVVTALSGDNLDFGKVDASIGGIIADLTSKGVLESAAFNFVACVIEDEMGRADRDSAVGDAPAMRRQVNARTWISAHGVTFVPHGAAAH